jgi:ribosomal protein L9
LLLHRLFWRGPPKALGEFSVPVKLHKDVTAHLKVVIEKEAAAE